MSIFRRTSAPPGSSPGTFAPLAADGPEPELVLIRYNKDDLEEDRLRGEDIHWTPAKPGMMTWADLRGFGDGSVLTKLGEQFGLHPLTISDIANLGQRPKVEDYANGIFVVMRAIELDQENRLGWSQVSMFFDSDDVLTFQDKEMPWLNNLRHRLHSGRKVIRESQADYLACMVMDAVVDSYFPMLEHYSDRLEEHEERILAEHFDDDLLGELYLTKRDLAAFRRSVWPLREALAHLSRESDEALSPSAKMYLRDTMDHLMQVIDVLESYRELASSLVDVYLSLVGQRTNDIMRVLTIVATIFIPLTFVAGIYGMNFDTSAPGNLPELGWRYGYFFFWVVCIIMTGLLLVAFRRLGWLGGKRRETK